MVGTLKKRGLVTSPLSRQDLSVPGADQRSAIQQEFDDIEWFFADQHHLTPTGELDFTAQAKMYEQMVEEHHIDVVLSSTNDDNALIHSYLHEKCPWLKGASMESLMLCNHKYYTRTLLIPEEYNLPYSLILLDEELNVEEIVSKVGLPLILKPTCGTNSAGIQVCRDESELIESVMLLKEQLGRETFCNSYKEMTLGLEEKYPFLLKPCILAESFIECTVGLSTNHTVEFCIQEGRYIPWIDEDNIYWKAQHGLYLGCGTPSINSDEFLQDVRLMATKVAERMISFGFNNSISNIEYFKLPDGSIKAMEINGRMFAQMRPVYSKLYLGGDSYRVMLDLQLGKQVSQPVLVSQSAAGKANYGLCVYVSTIKDGKAQDIFDYDYFEKLECNEETVIAKRLLQNNREKNLSYDADSGVLLAWLYVIGEDFDDCMRKVKPVYKNLLKEEYRELVWEDNYDIKAMLRTA